MEILKTLYYYECKKIWSRRLVRISFVVCLILAIFMGIIRLFESYVIDGVTVGSSYDETRKDQAYAQKLNGRKIDGQLLAEMASAYQKVPATREKHYSNTPEYQKYARPYSPIFTFTLGNTTLTAMDIFEGQMPDEQELYSQRQSRLEERWRNLGLSESEMEYWKKQENKIEKPITFQEHETYNQLFRSFETVGFLVIWFLSISLAGVFPQEHSRKTDQLILSSPMGKKMLYRAKILAGVTCGIVTTIVYSLVIWILAFVMYGGGGSQAPFQLYFRTNSDPITCGQAFLIAYTNMLIAAVLISIAVMVLSELLHSSMAAMAISAGLWIASMIVTVPEHYRILSQLWDWLPWCFLTPSSVFGKYTLSVFGTHLTSWQAAPIIYPLLSIAAALAGKTIYQRYQVSGR